MKQNERNEPETEYIIGRNSVRELLRADGQVERLLVAKGQRAGSIGQLLGMARDRNIPLRELPKSRLDEIAAELGPDGRQGNHQGIIAQVPAFRYSEMGDIFARAEQSGKPPFIVVLDGVQDPQNLGAVIRSAEALGAHGVIIGKRRSASLTTAVLKASSGAAAHIPVVKVTNINRTLEELKRKNVWAVGADPAGRPLASANLKGAAALVIGGDGGGMSRLTRELCDLVVRIEMEGRTRSLNAAAAAGILLYEKKRQDGWE
jgi:23S rRNA (guanosine2251-2'-O)-methyltransferase